jgi:ribosomal protein L13E
LSSRAKKEPRAKPKKPEAKAASAKPKGEAVAKPKPVEVAKPKGQAPLAVVNIRHEGMMKQRQARGFSNGELSGAGFSIHEASRLGLAMDIRRRTVLEQNVESLRSWFTPSKPVPAHKPPVAKAEAKPEEKPKKRAPPKKATK